MKNSIRYLLVLLFGIFVIPTSVFAKDKNVTYFMMYPDGSKEVTEDYSDTIKEKLIFTTVTDSSGKIVICDWMNAGKIRVVQKVPEGYRSDKTYENVDLSKTSIVKFVDYKGDNPITSRNSLYGGVFLLTLGGVFFFARKKRKILFIIPILFATFFFYQASADGNCFVVEISDGEGKGLEGVEVLFYAYPEVEESPAVKFVANGGTFFDGKEVMYFKLPSEMCEIDEFFDSLNDEEYDYWDVNSEYVYRDGYYPDGYDFPEYFTNGMEIPMKWYQDYNADLVKVIGNGGVLDFFGQKMTEAIFYRDSNWPEIARYFERDGYYYMGFDRNQTCRDPIDPWILKKGSFDGKIYYLCWDTTVDGIVVNDEYLFVGNVDDCFLRSNFSSYYRFFEFTEAKRRYHLNLARLDDGRYAFSNLFEYTETLKRKEDLESVRMDPYSIPIHKIEIVDHKRVIVTLTSDDFEISDSDGVSYIVTNSEKNAILENFYNQLDSSCVVRVE